MPHYIDCFMWGFQSHFRSTVEVTYRSSILELGRDVEPEVFLVGFLRDGGTGHAICVEPEGGPISPDDLAGAPARAEQIYADDRESKLWNSDPRTHELHQGWVRDRALAVAIAEVLEAKLDRHFIVASPSPVGDFRVFTSVGLPREVMDGYPALATKKVADDDRIVVSRSLLDAALNTLGNEASRALHEPDPGSTFGGFISAGDVARRAGETLAIDVAYRADSSQPSHGLFDSLNKLATTSYEKRVGVGRIVLAKRDAAGVHCAVLLKQPVPLKDTRTLRKLLEISSRGTRAVLINGRDAYGLGTIEDAYDPSTESVFEILVSGPGTWDLRHADTPLMAVTFGAPHLPVERLSRSRFDDTATRLFASEGGCDTGRLWALAMAAAEAEHGTMLVVSSGAASEASRLESQALVVQRLDTDEDLVRQVSKIDGAILVDPFGGLEAVGVILDGVAGTQGDRARGARFNSAIRYLESASARTMIVLVSEDGMLDLLPRLRPQLRRPAVAALLDDLRAASRLDPVNAERFHKALRPLKDIAFYLNQEQCDDINALVEEHWSKRKLSGDTILVIENPLRPDPQMSDEYLIE